MVGCMGDFRHSSLGTPTRSSIPVARTVKPSAPGNHISLEDFEAIEADIRRRMNDLDEQYREYFVARAKLEKELEEFQAQKRAMLDFVRKHRNRHGADAIRTPDAAKVVEQPRPIDSEPSAPQSGPHGAPKAQPVEQMPWGSGDFGQAKVLYVVQQSGRAGLSRREIVDRIAEISGHREVLASVTVWLYRLKQDGNVHNRNRRWFAVPGAKLWEGPS